MKVPLGQKAPSHAVAQRAKSAMRGISSSLAVGRKRSPCGAHPIIVNGIDDVAIRRDLADRTAFVNLAAVADEKRRSHHEILAAFEKMRPQLLGVLLDADLEES
jgi:hypothetical protein